MSLGSLKTLNEDPVGSMYAALARDPNPQKLDLGIGVYRDASGRSPIMPSVQQAQARIVGRQDTKEYMNPGGNARYCRATEKLVLGESHAALASGRVVTIQTPGAGGGLRVAAELIKLMENRPTVWLSEPTWSHQRLVMDAAGLQIAEYPYYDRAAQVLRFDEMIATLSRARRGDVILLHGCCHNPTGEDLTADQWRTLAETMAQTGLIPFVDLVYQGFGDGIEADAYGTRLLAGSVSEMILVTSSSKSFGIYRDRAGAVSLICEDADSAASKFVRHLWRLALSLYFMPPDAGAAIVAEILDDPALQAQWRDELDGMRNRIVSLRRQLSELLGNGKCGDTFECLRRQKGMFSLMPLSATQLGILRESHGIYLMPDSRINIAALSEHRIARVAHGIAEVLARH